MIKSPCIGVCTLDDTDQYCVGCLRTIDELQVWLRADDVTKQQIVKAVNDRKEIIHAAVVSDP